LSGRFCHGESPTVADICLVTQVTPAMTFNLSIALALVKPVYRIFGAATASGNSMPMALSKK
jgi:hypothetical protein